MRKLILNMFSILFAITIQAQKSDSLFTAANELYQAEKYIDAKNLYQQIIDQGHFSAEVFFNLANAWYKIGNSPRAILNYEKALLLEPNNEDIQFNLDLVKAYSVDKIEEIPEFFLKTWISGIGLWFTSNTWLILSIVSFIAALLLVLYFFFGKNVLLRKAAFALFVVLMANSYMAFRFSVQQKERIFNNPYSIVYEPTVTVKGSPSDSGTDLFVLHEGIKVMVLNEYQGWSEIRLANGNKGWMPTEMLLPISLY
jgi:tetratricopeptide (TPR) repeat protein